PVTAVIPAVARMKGLIHGPVAAVCCWSTGFSLLRRQQAEACTPTTDSGHRSMNESVRNKQVRAPGRRALADCPRVNNGSRFRVGRLGGETLPEFGDVRGVLLGVGMADLLLEADANFH